MTRVGRVNDPPHPALISPAGMGGSTALPALDDLTDVDAGSPSDGDTIIWDSGSGTWVPGPGGGSTPIALDDLTDVDVPSPADGDVLTWDAGAGMWVAEPADAAAAEATQMWRPVMAEVPSVLTVDGEPIWLVLVTADGDAIMVYG